MLRNMVGWFGVLCGVGGFVVGVVGVVVGGGAAFGACVGVGAGWFVCVSLDRLFALY